MNRTVVNLSGGFTVVFPTRVGMNRYITAPDGETRRIPHTRGDEPSVDAVITDPP